MCRYSNNLHWRYKMLMLIQRGAIYWSGDLEETKIYSKFHLLFFNTRCSCLFGSRDKLENIIILILKNQMQESKSEFSALIPKSLSQRFFPVLTQLVKNELITIFNMIKCRWALAMIMTMQVKLIITNIHIHIWHCLIKGKISNSSRLINLKIYKYKKERKKKERKGKKE